MLTDATQPLENQSQIVCEGRCQNLPKQRANQSFAFSPGYIYYIKRPDPDLPKAHGPSR